MKIRFYTQLMLLVGLLVTILPASAHQQAHDAQVTSDAYWHNMSHILTDCLTQFTPGYLLGLFGLLSILGYVAYKVKWSARASNGQ